MNNLEKLLQENRDQFDSTEPLDGHFERFRERLGIDDQPAASNFSRYGMLKVAAVILVLITGSILVFDLATSSIRERFSPVRASVAMTSEMNEAVQYYDARAMAQLKVVRKLANTPAQADLINGDAMKEMKSLDESTRELQKSLAGNPNCERLQDAILQNQQMKEGIMNTIVNHLNKH